IVAVPLVGSARPSMMRMLVVLPAPLTPRKAVTRPGSAVAVKPSRTVTGPYCLLSWWNERVGMSVSSCGRAGLADTNDPARQGSGASAQRPKLDLHLWSGAAVARRTAYAPRRTPESRSGKLPRCLLCRYVHTRPSLDASDRPAGLRRDRRPRAVRAPGAVVRVDGPPRTAARGRRGLGACGAHHRAVRRAPTTAVDVHGRGPDRAAGLLAAALRTLPRRQHLRAALRDGVARAATRLAPRLRRH